MRTGLAISPEEDFLHRLEDVPEEFDFVEVGIGEMEIEPEDIDVEEWKDALEEYGFSLIVHLPFRHPVATTVNIYNRAKVEYIRELLELASKLEAEKAVLHANLRYGQEKEKVRESLMGQLERINGVADENNIELCVENIPFEDSKPAELLEFGELVRETGASICLDTGHAFAEKGQKELEEFAEEFSDLISHLHVQDSRGDDEHLAVGHGEIEFKPLLEKLGEFSGTATFEIFSPDLEYHSVSRRKLLELEQ